MASNFQSRKIFSKFAIVLFVVGLTPCLKYFSPSGVAATTCETGGFLVLNMIGIYKITSPTGRVYVGQSIDIEKRFKTYRTERSYLAQTRLRASILKHGVDSHIFEIIVECDVSELNRLERHYQELYECIGPKGLNCSYVKSSDRTGELSEETRRKISEANKGKKFNISPEVKERLRIKRSGTNAWNYGKECSFETKKKIGEKQKGELNHNYGKSPSASTRKKISEAHKGEKHHNYGKPMPDHIKQKLIAATTGGTWNRGRKHTEETKRKFSAASKGRVISADARQKISAKLTGRKMEQESKAKMQDSQWKCRVVLDLNTGVFYDSASKLARLIGMRPGTLVNMLLGNRRNHTQYIYA